MSFRILAIKIVKKLHLSDLIKKVFFRNRRAILSPDGTAELPLSVGFELTTKCNLNCVMCYQKEERLLGKRDLSFEEIKKVINNLGNIKQASLIGAEIFTRPDIFQIIEEFIKKGIKLYLTSNGTLINEEIAEKLKKYKKGIRGIGFSLDGSKETHNKIRGLDSAFDRTIKAINLLKNDFNVSINSVMMESNLDELYDLIRYLSNMGVVNFGLTMEMFATAEEVIASKKILGEEDLPLATSVSKQPEYKFSLNKLKETINKIRTIKGINVVIHPDIFDCFPEELYDGSLRGKTKLICKNMFVGRVNAQGDVIFCPFIKKSFGNLLNESMEQIWNKEEFKSFRNKLVKNNLLPVCKRCCKLGLNAEKNEEQSIV
jgi:MoaA/NifB/PqqE/SkfB family radical SAM enzyme